MKRVQVLIRWWKALALEPPGGIKGFTMKGSNVLPPED